MKFAIEFYRLRDTDDAHALIGHETTEAADLDDAIALAHRLARTLNMPQQPDAMSIKDGDGQELYVHRFGVPRTPDDGRSS